MLSLFFTAFQKFLMHHLQSMSQGCALAHVVCKPCIEGKQSRTWQSVATSIDDMTRNAKRVQLSLPCFKAHSLWLRPCLLQAADTRARAARKGGCGGWRLATMVHHW